MIFGIGTDIVQVSRMKSALEKHGVRFAEKILSPNEILIFHERHQRSPNKALHFLANRFAAKEAFSKATGLGFRHPITWHTLEVTNNSLGKPEFKFYGELAAWITQHSLKAMISISDEVEQVIAFVIIETDAS
jgi:holo-[acyl-carrier-protein] synthase